MRIAVIGNENVGTTSAHGVGRGPDFGVALLRRG
jgi:hypothetical protein